MARDPYTYFRLEARELLERFGQAVLAPEKGEGGADRIRLLLRLAHTLKGAARVVRQPEIADAAHVIEDVLEPYRDSADSMSGGAVDALLAQLDKIRDQLALIAPPKSAETTTALSAAAADDNLRTVRADLVEIDALQDGVSEVQALLNALRPVSGMVERARHLSDLLLEQLSPAGVSDNLHRGAGPSGKAHATAEELRSSLGKLERDVGFAIDQMDRELRQVSSAAEQLRLAPAGTLFALLDRTARDAARTLDRQVKFEGRGADIRLDAHILATIQPALVQIIRNAVAHGIESEGQRQALGKPAAGRISVDVARRGRQIVFACRDDGPGVDLEAVRRIALQRGLVGSQVAAFGTEELVRLLLRGGITTSGSVTEVAGRGIGLDVVREAVEKLDGEITFQTEAGVGTTFELLVPLTLAAIEALIIETAGSITAIPLDAVRSALRLGPGDITWGASGPTIVHEKSAIPFLALPMALHGQPSPAGRSWPAIVMAGRGGLAAIGADRLLGTAPIVARPLPESALTNPIVAGGWLDVEGIPQLILDPDGLVAAAQRGDAADIAQSPQTNSVLVIDDSLTTRMLEQSILESAGYQVDIATSGEDALESAHRKQYSLFLVDVEMPGIDGFTFIERVRADPALRDIPAILVTSRSSPDDRQRGKDAGAQGYVVKSEFDQAQVLAMIKAQIG